MRGASLRRAGRPADAVLCSRGDSARAELPAVQSVEEVTVATWAVFESLARRAYQRELRRLFALVFVVGIALGTALGWWLGRS